MKKKEINNETHFFCECGIELKDRNSIDVGQCLECFAIDQSDFDEDETVCVKSNNCYHCGVPLDIHGTSCGWINTIKICDKDGIITDKRSPFFGDKTGASK